MDGHSDSNVFSDDVLNTVYGVNIIKNSSFGDGLAGWAPIGQCQLTVKGQQHAGDLKCVVASMRTETWMGPSQAIADVENLKVGTAYLVSALVRLGSSGGDDAAKRQTAGIALNVDDNWLSGGVADVGSDRWVDIVGSFFLDKQPSKVVFTVQGPSPGIDLMVMKPQMHAVNRKARFRQLKKKTDKVRKRNIVLKFHGADISGAPVKVRQTASGFPFGTCINRANIADDAFNSFFLNTFSWAVFENEMKWYWTEQQQGALNYGDADALLDFCAKNGKRVRGHCIFWEVENVVQPWLKVLSSEDLRAAVDGRLQSLVTRYKGRLEHYDVNNEMLHGSFYKDRLGDDIHPYMFKRAQELDPGAALFVNDYNVETSNDPAATPEKYVAQVLDLQKGGAAVGGIGVQGHMTHPVGEVLCSALDKLAVLGLPLWITELDVVAADVDDRADDLEAVLREAYAHPAVEGVMLWGFMEGRMWRSDAFLVDADGSVNAAGRRLLALMKEWTSHADGRVDAKGEFKFRGFHGTYSVEVTTAGGAAAAQTFVVDKGDDSQVLVINI